MFNKINTMGLFGLNAFPVAAEITAAKGIAGLDIVGLPDLAVQESKLRIRAALENCGLKILPLRLTINLAPASVKKSGSMFDLPILVAILAVQETIRADLSDSAFIGEVSLGGDILAINGVLSMVLAAKAEGIKNVYVPKQNETEASVAEGITVYGVNDINSLIHHLRGEKQISPAERYIPDNEFAESALDFADVKSQGNVKRAMEIAAAGFHNVLMIGPPGTGKSMIAKRLPTILPAMSFDESIETTRIHSVAGILNKDNPLVITRPFRDVSHTASAVGLIGGGSIPKPGEISLAHNGVLFLDEFPEFDRKVLETLRQPLENGSITISRAAGSVEYPCNITLIAAMNPCPCGNFGHPKKKCTCSAKAVESYLGRISQPVLDRIDLQVEVMPVNYSELSEKSKSECSAAIRQRVEKAREVQKKRFEGTGIRSNSTITPKYLHEFCEMDNAAKETMQNSFDRLALSARAYDRVLKVARTIADLDGSEIIGKSHIFQAIQYRTLDRKYWGNA